MWIIGSFQTTSLAVIYTSKLLVQHLPRKDFTKNRTEKKYTKIQDFHIL